MRRFVVTGILEVEDNELDDEDPSGLTEEAYDTFIGDLEQAGLSEITFTPK